MKSFIICLFCAISFCHALHAQDSSSPVENTQRVEICEGETYIVGESLYGEPGCYVDVIPTADGRDSIVTTVLDVRPVPETFLQVEICEGANFKVGNEEYVRSGSYVQVLTAESGCDSLVLTYLTVVDSY